MEKVWYLVFILLLGSCGGQSTEEGTEQLATPAVDPYGMSDSIRQLYHTYLAELTDPFPLNCRPEKGKVNPVDAAPRDTTFFVFREHLKRVVADKDIFGLLANIDEDIKIGFGAENGLKAFIQTWELDSPDKVPQSPLWEELAEVLALGGQFSGDGDYFEAPYLDPCYPATTTIDIMQAQVVTGAGVRMRSGPGLHTRVMKTLSYDILQYIETTPIEETIAGEVHPWVKVKTIEDEEGFVYGKFLRSPIDLRAIFRQGDNGQWKIVSLVAGD